jgi:predicted ArsR family transcriptional regulator
MTRERKEHGATRQSIMQLLRRHSCLTALEISEALTIGAVGIRQHLAVLERDGLVMISGLRRNIGRPSHLYQLTERAEALFPKHYDVLSTELLDTLASLDRGDLLETVLEQRCNDQVERLTPQLAGLSREERVEQLSELLSREGYMCECEPLDDGSFRLTKYNCPIDCVARRYPAFCSQELKLYSRLVGVDIRQESTIAGGDHCCRFHIPA